MGPHTHQREAMLADPTGERSSIVSLACDPIPPLPAPQHEAKGSRAAVSKFPETQNQSGAGEMA